MLNLTFELEAIMESQNHGSHNLNLIHEKLYSPHGGPRHLFVIPVKNFHLFEITKLVFSFYLKLHNFK